MARGEQLPNVNLKQSAAALRKWGFVLERVEALLHATMGPTLSSLIRSAENAGRWTLNVIDERLPDIPGVDDADRPLAIIGIGTAVVLTTGLLWLRPARSPVPPDAQTGQLPAPPKNTPAPIGGADTMTGSV